MRHCAGLRPSVAGTHLAIGAGSPMYLQPMKQAAVCGTVVNARSAQLLVNACKSTGGQVILRYVTAMCNIHSNVVSYVGGLLRSPFAALPVAGAGRCPRLLGGALHKAVAAVVRPRHAVDGWRQACAECDAVALDWEGPFSPAGAVCMAVDAWCKGPVRVPVV
jgi:hypothetical protein